MINVNSSTARKIEKLSQNAAKHQNDYKARISKINPNAAGSVSEGREDAGMVVTPSWLKK